MMFKSTLLVAAVAITSSNAFAFHPNSRIPSTFAARTMDVSPSSSTELNMGLRTFFTGKKSTTQSTAGGDISSDEVRALFSLWNNALATGDSRLVASRYAKDAVLLPTVSDTPRTDKASITNYFDSFLLKKPQGVITEGNIRIGDGWAQDAGCVVVLVWFGRNKGMKMRTLTPLFWFFTPSMD